MGDSGIERISCELVISWVDDLERQVETALRAGKTADWGSVWETIRSIGGSFPQAWFSSGDERRSVWNRFQEIAGRVKHSQREAETHHQVFTNRVAESKLVAERIMTLAQSAWPHEDGFIDLIGTITGAKILAEVFVRLIELGVQVMSFGLLKPDRPDDRVTFLKHCSENLKQAWQRYHESRNIFVLEDREAMRDVLLRVQAELNAEWDKLKSETRNASNDRVNRKRELIAEVGSLGMHAPSSAGEKSKELIARWKEIGFVGDSEQEHALWSDFRFALDRFWEQRKGERISHLEKALEATRANVEKLRASVTHDESVLEEKEEKLANVFDGNRADEIREHLRGVISSLEEKIERKRGWIEEQEERIEDMERSLQQL